MRTRTSPRNQEILFRELFKSPAVPVPAVEPLDLAKAWWLSPRVKRQIERDRARAARRAAFKRARGGLDA
jgi:hypothetical protein